MKKKNTHKVLIADESLSCQLLMRVLMKKASINAKIVGNGPAAIDAATSEKFDLILLNTNLPQISGIAAADAIRKKGIMIPIIAILSSERNADIKKCLKVSFNGYLQKPITKIPLYEMMAKFLTATPIPQTPATLDAATYIDKFFEDIPNVLSEIEDLNRNVDLEMIAELVQELKDTGSTTGLESMQACADELDQLLTKVHMDPAHESLDEIYSICLKLINKQNT